MSLAAESTPGEDPEIGTIRSTVSVVYFSASRPWLSQLSMPRAVIEGAPVILVVLVFELFAIVTIIKPRSGWAFSFDEKEKKNGS
jgi:hypothetical protein